MGSNGFTAFLTKLLRPQKAEKSSSKQDILRKRHSAPVPDWFDVELVEPPPTPLQEQTNNVKTDKKTPKQKQKSKPKKQQPVKKSKSDAQALQKPKSKKKSGRSSSVENLNRINEVKTKDEHPKPEAADKNVKNKKQKNNNGLAYWFCMSHNIDSLQRGMAPFAKDQAIKNANHTQGDSAKTGKSPSLAGVIRREKKRDKKNSKYRYSAPATDNLAIFIPKDDTDPLNGIPDLDTRRRLSPGVRYRVDGTLERPYVFPSGLTFGPDGRRVRLRSSTPRKSKRKEEKKDGEVEVKAVVHESSKQGSDLSYEYEYGEGNSGSFYDESYDDFDARKAFYLKYDSNNACNGNENPFRYSMPNFPVSFNVFSTIDPTIPTGPNNIPDSFSPRHQSREHLNPDVHTKNDHNFPERSRNKPNRYSLPPSTSDECVYMGSCENLNVWDFEQEDSPRTQEGLNLEIPRGSKRGSRRRQKRYSMPTPNLEYVYQGSLENIQLLNAADKRAGVLSLRRDLDPDCLNDDNLEEMAVMSDTNRRDESDIHTADSCDKLHKNLNEREHSAQSGQNVGAEAVAVNGGIDTIVERNRHKYFDVHRHSLPELQLGELKLARAARSEGNESDFDVQADSKPLQLSSSFDRSPFSRNMGRSSCMPGNKRSIAPPPAVFQPSSLSSQTVVPGQDSGKKQASPGGGLRRFRIPPPPTYTPPREEMEDALLSMSKHSNSKGSQTDLTADRASPDLNMEDRDMSLKRSDAKEILSSISKLCAPAPRASQPQSSPNEVIATQTSKRTSSTSSACHAAKFYISSETSSGMSPSCLTTEAIHWNFKRQNCLENSKLNASVTSQGSDEVFTSDTNLKRFSEESPHSTHRKNPFLQETSSTSENSEVFKYKTQQENKTTTKENRAVTSTPKVVRRNNTDVHDLSQSRQQQDKRPVPMPRKRNSAIGLVGLSSFDVGNFKNIQSDYPADNRTASSSSDVVTSPSSQRTPPVPKKRRNLSSCSGTQNPPSSPSSPNETKDSSFPPASSPSPASTTSAMTPSISTPSTSPLTQKESENIKPSSIAARDKNIGDDKINNIGKNVESPDMVSDTKHKAPPGDLRSKPFQSPVSILKHPTETSRQSHNLKGAKASSMCDLSRDDGFEFIRNTAKFEDTDLNCVADDELTACDDGDADDDVEENYSGMGHKRRSLRKCVSVDDLLRSGSILDRSMIMARKRRRRMRERKCKSQMLTSGDAEDEYDGGGAGKDFISYAYQFHKERSEERRKRRKKGEKKRRGLNQTDSGHDSDSMSFISASPPSLNNPKSASQQGLPPQTKNDPASTNHHRASPKHAPESANGVGKSRSNDKNRLKVTKNSWEERMKSNRVNRISQSCENVNDTAKAQIKSKSSVHTIV